MAFLLFDVGGTWTHIALSSDGESLEKQTRVKTASTPEKFVAQLTKHLAPSTSITGIAGGIRGVLMEDKRGVGHDHLLTGWQGVDVAGMIEDVYRVPVRLENDAALAGLGEVHFGVGQGIDIVVYHDISTGVGGARLVGGVLDSDGVAFEPGLQIIDVDRTILGDDVVPTLENLISGRAVALRMGTIPTDIPAEDVLWEELAGYLASGLRNSVLYWSPDVIILGGAMVQGNPRIPLETVRQETVRALDGVVESPYITLGTLEQSAGLYGALALLTKF